MSFSEMSFEDTQRHIAGMPLGPMAPSLGVVFETGNKQTNKKKP